MSGLSFHNPYRYLNTCTSTCYSPIRSTPSIEDQAKINALKSQLSRAKMQRNKHLANDLERQLRLLVCGAFF